MVAAAALLPAGADRDLRAHQRRRLRHRIKGPHLTQLIRTEFPGFVTPELVSVAVPLRSLAANARFLMSVLDARVKITACVIARRPEARGKRRLLI